MGTLQNYNSFNEKEGFYKVKIIQTKKEFDIWFDSLIEENADSIWRGLSESKFKHYTSLQRFWLQNDLKKSSDQVESYLRHIFNYTKAWNQEFFTKYFENYGISSFPIFSALSILRHHGCPTPLIDWTRNPLIGLFFGVFSVDNYSSNNEIDNYFSLYEMKSNHLYYKFDFKKESHKLWESQKKSIIELNVEHKNDPNFIDKFYQDFMNYETTFFNIIKYFPIYMVKDTSIDQFKYFINNNYNITNQEGLFIINVDPEKPLENAIIDRIINSGVKDGYSETDIQNAVDKQTQNFISYEIHKSLKQYILLKLKNYNIDHDYVFPNLSKLANECIKDYLENLE